MRRLDRFLLLRAGLNSLLLLTAGLLLFIGFDILFNLDDYLRQELPPGWNRLLAVLGFYGLQLPALISVLLPPAVIGGCLFTAAGSLIRREYVAVATSGVSPRQANRGLVLLTLLATMLQLLLGDLVAPALHARAAEFDAFIGLRQYPARVWRDPETDAVWFAHRARLPTDAPPEASLVAIIPPKAGMMLARGLYWQDGWWLQEPILDWDGSDRQPRLSTTAMPLPHTHRCSLSPANLRQAWLAREAMSAWELWQQGDQLHRALAYARLTQLLILPLMLLIALPILVRFRSGGGLITAGCLAMVASCWPWLCLVLAARSAEVSRLGAETVMAIALMLAAAPGCWLWLRWRL
ncbi:MAG: LptF/LptG family permease [Planctomycetota bacterium]